MFCRHVMLLSWVIENLVKFKLPNEFFYNSDILGRMTVSRDARHRPVVRLGYTICMPTSRSRMSHAKTTINPDKKCWNNAVRSVYLLKSATNKSKKIPADATLFSKFCNGKYLLNEVIKIIPANQMKSSHAWATFK